MGDNMAEIIKINENTWRFEDGNVRFFLLCGSEKAALIDSGMNTPDAKDLAKKLTDLPIILINTHADRDHISGNGSFDALYMSPNEEPNYRDAGGKGDFIPVCEGDEIDLGGRVLRIIDNPGHTPGSIAILDKENRVLIGGDSIQDGNIFMFGKYRDLKTYIKSLKHISEMNDSFDCIYPMHGSFPVYPDLIPKLIEGAQEILDGKAKGEKVDMFGRSVTLYKFPYAGFLCEPN